MTGRGRIAGFARSGTSAVKRTTDVIVIGAGVIGCAVAYEMGRRGLKVHVCE
ncbi:MAG: FAD-dependent oxidoreductase, partial [Vicinamibacteraceae bacterium]